MIRVDGLVKYYGSHRVVSDLSFQVEANQVVGLLGLNGAGKTTILRILAGDLEASAGAINVNGESPLHEPIPYRRQVGFLPEQVPLYPHMTVWEYLGFLGRLRGVGRAKIKNQIEACAERVGLEQHLDSPLGALSHGYAKRLGIAATLVHNPSLIILDEPIAGLDPRQIVDMRALVRDLARDHTVLLSSHILREISRTCDQILVIREGTIAAAGSEEDLGRRFANSHLLHLSLRGDKAAIGSFLSAFPGVTAQRVVAAREGLIDLEVESDKEIREELVAGLVGAGFGVRSLERPTHELEATFMELTGSVEPVTKSVTGTESESTTDVAEPPTIRTPPPNSGMF